ncbi:MAG: hypothetical protein ACFE0J_26170 [Elainellaceae cyanobacterium]
MATINIQSESQQNGSWLYNVVLDDRGTTHQYTVTLNSSEYESWARNQAKPSDVIKAAFEFLLEREPASSIMSSFDCSVIRRYFPDVDRELPKKLSA